MNDKILNVNAGKEFHYSINDITELYGLDQWTTRMWGNWFKIPGYLSTADGDILFTQQAVERIGVICRLMKEKMKVEEIHKYLESDNSLEEA